MRTGWFIAFCAALASTSALAIAPGPEIPAAAQALPFDPAAATRAWLDTVPAAQRARTDAYFEGGYWIRLWNVIIAVASAWLLMASSLSSRWREAAERRTRRRPLQVGLYALAIMLAFAVLSLPFSFYTGYLREHQYGLSNLSLGGWLREALIGLALTLVFGALAVMAVYGVIRRAPRSWWLWGAGVVLLFTAFGSLIYPPFIAPMFNRYEPVADPAVRQQVLALARANQVPADEVYQFNASKQHKRISANVAGLAGTMRIALNDNLLERTSMAEIRMVMAHEIGHYALNHLVKGLVFSGLVFVAMFAFARWAFAAVHARRGERWGVRDVADPAGLPILLAALTVVQLLATPVNNTLTRVQEIEADLYGLNASREPDGFAAVALKLGEYRKMDPGPLEEVIFFTHPSGKRRIEMAMRWKAEMLAGSVKPGP